MNPSSEELKSSMGDEDSEKVQAKSPSSENDDHGSSGSSGSSDSSRDSCSSSSGSASSDESSDSKLSSMDKESKIDLDRTIETEVDDLSLNRSSESFKSADLTLTRRLESDLIETVNLNSDKEETLLQQKVDNVEVEAVEPLVDAVVVEPVASSGGPVVTSSDTSVLVKSAVSSGAELITPAESSRGAMLSLELQPANQSASVLAPGSVDQLVSQSTAPKSINPVVAQNAAPLKPATPVAPPVIVDKTKEEIAKEAKKKDKKARKLVKKSERDRKHAIDTRSSDDQLNQIEEGKRLARLVEKFITESENRSKGSPRRKRVKHKSKSPKSVESKKPKYSGSKTESGSESPKSALVAKPQPALAANRIARLSASKKFQQLAMARAKALGLSKDDNDRVIQLTAAIKVAEQMEFIVHPTHAYPDFNSVVGTGLPHIQGYVREFQEKYGPIAKATVILNLTIEKNKILSKSALIGPEPSNRFVALWQFNNTLQRVVPSSLPAMQTSASAPILVPPVGNVSGPSPDQVAIDFDQISDLPSTSGVAPVIKRKHKSSTSSSVKPEKIPAHQEHKEKGKGSRKKHRSRKSE